MKIGLVSPYDYAYPGGVMAHIYHLKNGLEENGHEVKIIAPLSGPPPNYIGNQGLIPLGRSVPVPVGGSTSRISLSVWLQPEIKELLKKEAFDVIHLHEPLAPIIPLFVLHLSKSLNVGTFHAFHNSSKTYFFSKYILKNWHNKLDGRIAVSKPALDFVSKYFPGNYEIIPNGIDFKKFSMPQREINDYKDGKINILFVGRLEKRKGLKHLLVAYSKVKLQHPNSRLIVVGPGNPEPDCYRLIAERSIEDVVFVGAVPSEDLPSYYQAADIFCSPATGGESFGIVLLEAMASGKPIVASNIEGYSSVMSNENEGLLVPPKDEEALTEALLNLIKDRSLREKLGNNGLLKAPNYDWSVVTKKILDYYELSYKNKL